MNTLRMQQQERLVINLDAALHSPQYVEVRRRIFRQLIESLIYEELVRPAPSRKEGGQEEWVLQGQDERGHVVEYRCAATRKRSFGRVRLTHAPVRRVANGQEAEADSLATFLLELAPVLQAEPEKLSAFLDELNQTLLKDTLAQYFKQQTARRGEEAPLVYDELEGDVMEGHPYHPCYKSRVGFDADDHLAYGPEFKPRLRPLWVAVAREEARLSHLKEVDPVAFLREELGEQWEHLCTAVREKGRDPTDYVFIPVHPWQWREVVIGGFFEAMERDRVICLGESEDEFRPQQSIRTLANFTSPHKAYLKFPLSIANTSTGRILGQHTILNAAILSDWLGELWSEDAYLRDELRLILLREVMGASYHHQGLPAPLGTKVYGVLGAIWRESIHPALAAGEEAFPYNGLAVVDAAGRPLIDRWVRRLGLREWLARLLEVSIQPLIHLLYAHGIGMEAHAQNMLLVHREGLPVRIALKDFHDGLRYSARHLACPERRPEIHYPPSNHVRTNRNSFIEKEEAGEVKDFFQDAFFFINLGELAMFLEGHYGLPEQEFWGMTAGVIHGYQRSFPRLQERFAVFDLFSETIEVEKLTRRRLFAESGVMVHRVPNPLHAFRR